MNMIQALEEQQYSDAARFDRFDGFDRGDLDYDYDEEQRCKNEEAEAEYQRECAAARPSIEGEDGRFYPLEG